MPSYFICSASISQDHNFVQFIFFLQCTLRASFLFPFHWSHFEAHNWYICIYFDLHLCAYLAGSHCLFSAFPARGCPLIIYTWLTAANCHPPTKKNSNPLESWGAAKWVLSQQLIGYPQNGCTAPWKTRIGLRVL